MFGHTDEVYEKLQAEADLAMINPLVASDFNRPILNRLRDFVTVAITSMKLYPSTMMLQLVVPDRIEVKVVGLSTAVIVFASAEQLVAEVYLNKMANTKHLPFPRILKHDVSFASLPVAFAVYTFIAGVSLSTVADETMQRVAAKQVGRAIRSLHLIPAHGLGAPQMNGKWANRNWPTVLQQWLTVTGDYERILGAIGSRLFNQLIELTIKHPVVQQFTPSVLLGEIRTESAMVMVHGNIQLEGVMRSGLIVAGDAMFDVASSMRTSLTLAFRQGFFEGYTMHAPISADEILRAKRYAILWRVIDSVRLATSETDMNALEHGVALALAELRDTTN